MEDITPQEKYDNRNDPLLMAVNTPKSKISQFTVIPTGGVLAFAGSTTIQQFGKPEFEDGDVTPMEFFMDTIYTLNRSRGGMMLAGLMKLALAKVETSAEESDGNRTKFLKME